MHRPIAAVLLFGCLLVCSCTGTITPEQGAAIGRYFRLMHATEASWVEFNGK
jgi:hypothetical protein